jgi:hypothetical protein
LFLATRVGRKTCAILTVLLRWVPTCGPAVKPEHKSVCFETYRPPIEFERPVDRMAQAEFDRLVVYADSRSRSANHIVSTSGRSQHSALEPVITKEAQSVVSQKL